MPKDYHFRVIWSEETQEYIGLCEEIPAANWHAHTKEDAETSIHNFVNMLDDTNDTYFKEMTTQ